MFSITIIRDKLTKFSLPEKISKLRLVIFNNLIKIITTACRTRKRHTSEVITYRSLLITSKYDNMMNTVLYIKKYNNDSIPEITPNWVFGPKTKM